MRSWITRVIVARGLPGILYAYYTTKNVSMRKASFSLAYAVIPTEIGIPTYKATYFNESKNEKPLVIVVDLAEKKRLNIILRIPHTSIKLPTPTTIRFVPTPMSLLKGIYALLGHLEYRRPQ